jgi:integration host factor subunit beta
MVKSELINTLSERQPHLLRRDVELAVNCLLEQLINGLLEGERIEIRDFGSFTIRHREARLARNPKTGESVNLPPKVVVHFKPGKGLKAQVDVGRQSYRIKS